MSLEVDSDVRLIEIVGSAIDVGKSVITGAGSSVHLSPGGRGCIAGQVGTLGIEDVFVVPAVGAPPDEMKGIGGNVPRSVDVRGHFLGIGAGIDQPAAVSKNTGRGIPGGPIGGFRHVDAGIVANEEGVPSFLPNLGPSVSGWDRRALRPRLWPGLQRW
jgi:hypothetical protein